MKKSPYLPIAAVALVALCAVFTGTFSELGASIFAAVVSATLGFLAMVYDGVFDE